MVIETLLGFLVFSVIILGSYLGWYFLEKTNVGKKVSKGIVIGLVVLIILMGLLMIFLTFHYLGVCIVDLMNNGGQCSWI